MWDRILLYLHRTVDVGACSLCRRMFFFSGCCQLEFVENGGIGLKGAAFKRPCLEDLSTKKTVKEAENSINCIVINF